MIFQIPIVCFLGWIWLRYLDEADLKDGRVWPSFSGVLLASFSALAGLAAGLYADFAKPRADLGSFYLIGLGLSLSALLLGMLGLFFKNPLRWQAPVAAFATFFFWFLTMSAE